MDTLKKSHSREMDKLKRSSGDGVDGLQTEVVQLQVEMENMSQKYMEEIENLKVCFTDIISRPNPFFYPIRHAFRQNDRTGVRFNKC